MHTSTPVCAGVPFDVLNPRMDQQQVPPATAIQLYTVNGKPYLTPGEADRVAKSLSTKWNTTAEIRGGEVPLDFLQVLRTVPAAPVDDTESIPAGETSADQTGPVTVESVPPDNAGIPHSWLSPAAQPGATLRTLPESGLFSLEAWAETLNLSVETIGHMMHQHGITSVDGKIDASNWWRTIATANTRFPVKSTAWRDLPIFGLVTVTVENWKPKNARSVPPSLTDGLGMWTSAQWAMLFNASAVARHRGHWACVTVRGGVVVLSGIRLQDRPVDVGTFPAVCVQGGLTFHAAEQMAIGANGPRIELARVPREWTIPVRLASSVEQETIGGDAC